MKINTRRKNVVPNTCGKRLSRPLTQSRAGKYHFSHLLGKQLYRQAVCTN